MTETVEIYMSFDELDVAAEIIGAPPTGEDAGVRNTDDTYNASVSSGGLLTVPDSQILKADGVTVLLSIPATIDKTTTQILNLMSVGEVRADLNTNADLAAFIQALTTGAGDLSNLTTAQLQALTSAQVQVLTESQIQSLTAAQIANLTQAQVQSLTNTQIGYLSAAQIAVLANTQLANLTATQLQYIVQNLVTNAQFNTWLSVTQRNNLGNIGPLQTGITTSQVAHDDGDYEYGRLAGFSVLKQNNAFGNTSRFTSEAGNQNYVNNYLIDHATGLAWYLVTQAAATWQNAIIGAEAASFQIGAGGPTYSDWILPNIGQLLSLRNYSDSFGYPAFSSNNNNWSSSTDPALPATRALFTGQRGRVNEQDMTTLTPYKICRFHYT